MVRIALVEPQVVFACSLWDLLRERGIDVVATAFEPGTLDAPAGTVVLVDLDAVRLEHALETLAPRYLLCGLAIDPLGAGAPFPVLAKDGVDELACALGELAGAHAFATDGAR